MNYLFDLDGLLINSEELYFQANCLYFSRFGFEFTKELHREGTGKKFAEWIKTITNIDIDGETLLAERNEIYFEIAKTKLHLMPGARETLEYAKARGKVGMVTSSNKDYVDTVFGLINMDAYFDILVTGEQVMNGKPSPDGYLVAAELLSVNPTTCIVFEDAPNGVEAGKKAGMKVVAVPSTFVKGDRIFSTADLLIETLSDYSLYANQVEELQ